MTDLRNISEIEIGEYTVRLGEQDDSEQFDAAVVEAPKQPIQVMAERFLGKPSSEPETSEHVEGAPIVDHEKPWIAAGMAVQEYIDQQGGAGG
jgi:hypothetical protein